MQMSSNRSPSPLSTRPNSRTSEVNNPMRRSFIGSPFAKPSIVPRKLNPTTPANSPSEFGRRNSIDNERENGKEHNLMKLVRNKSPAAVKGTKNFMSPTISASSKINAASPRKKILAERNELVPPSVSFSLDDKSSTDTLSDVCEDIDIKSQSDMGSDENKFEASCESDVTDLADHKEIVSNSKPPLISRSLESNSGVKSRPSADCASPCPIIAPLDADPSVPPYDPKTNYLSPRPQFLHYKPNPRIEVYLSKEKGLDSDFGKRLEDTLFESLSDAENSDETESEGPSGESDDASIVNAVIEEDKKEHAAPEIQLPEELVEAKGISKRKSFVIVKYISWMVVLAIAFIFMSVTDTPVIGDPMYRNQTFSEAYGLTEIAGFAKANLDGIARSFKVWSASSISYLSKFALPPIKNLAAIQFGNITAMQEEIPSAGNLMADKSNKGAEESYQQVELGPAKECELRANDDMVEGDFEGPNEAEVVEQTHLESPQIEEEKDVESEIYNKSIEGVFEEQKITQSEEHLIYKAEMINYMDNKEQEIQHKSKIFVNNEIKPEGNSYCKDESAIVPQDSEIQPEFVVESGETPSENDILLSTNFEASSESSKSDITNEISERLHSKVDGSDDHYVAWNMVGISFLILTALAAAVLVYTKQVKASKSAAAIPVNPLLSRQMIHKTPPVEHTHTEMFSRNWSAEVEMVGESCHSGMSSLQNSLPNMRNAGEVQSQERKLGNVKRESFASSDCSMGSPTYGSFTTYEILHKKHQGDEETIVTPVRRSSRIRKQVTSP